VNLNELRASGKATLTVDELVPLLGVSRGVLYSAAKESIATGEGLPVVAMGRRLLIPVGRLLQWLGEETVETAPLHLVPSPQGKGA